ncbi:hypothetical protein RRG08_021847 [Elysia crispata]|uniref:Uncharacterized protein n=1 Tax=Elysia crispata TaxID=231223 RepID=A0AAE1DPC5_9GAST|nr:hypothetical protein RRG08_021847 [Elysia crispata]
MFGQRSVVDVWAEICGGCLGRDLWWMFGQRSVVDVWAEICGGCLGRGHTRRERRTSDTSVVGKEFKK